MAVVCFIQCKVDPFQQDKFKKGHTFTMLAAAAKVAKQSSEQAAFVIKKGRLCGKS
jgi:hypothetical protein